MQTGQVQGETNPTAKAVNDLIHSVIDFMAMYKMDEFCKQILYAMTNDGNKYVHIF